VSAPVPVPVSADPRRRTLAAGDLKAVLLPSHGMLCASLRHRGAELLRRVGDLDGAAARGGTAGIPLLHPWANRLSGLRYRAAGREVVLDRGSPLLHLDERGLPIHGVPWPRLCWDVREAAADRMAARLEWTRDDLLAVFPFPHRLDLAVSVRADAITCEVILTAGDAGPVPVAFGFHPYLGLPGAPRESWRLETPALRRLAVDPRGIPTGASEEAAPSDEPLSARSLDDGFALDGLPATFALSDGTLRIEVEFLEGFTHVQLFAPPGEPLVAIEPMTAPVAALSSAQALRVVEAGGTFRAAFRVRVGEPAPP
jgi:aldose 1-epimerase